MRFDPSRPYRIHDRRVVRLDARVRFPASTLAYDARVVDIGLGGACVELTRFVDDVRSGDRLAISFQAPTLWDPLEMHAQAVWARSASLELPLRVGVRFEHGGPRSTLALFELITSLVM